MEKINVIELYKAMKTIVSEKTVESNGKLFHGNIIFNFHNGILVNANVGDEVLKINQNIK